MATVTTTIKVTSRGSGTSNYTAYTSVLHLGGGYRTWLKFNLSSIPQGSTISSVILHMTHSSSTYRAAQSVVFKTSTQSSWNYTSTGSTTKTSTQVSGNHYKWDITSLASKMLALGSNCNLHLSTSDTQDRTYNGSISSVYIEVTYEEPTKNLHRYNGSSWEQAIAYRYNGTSWEECLVYRYNGSTWEL